LSFEDKIPIKKRGNVKKIRYKTAEGISS